MHDAARHPDKQHDEREHAHQAKLFADDSQQKVGVRLGQPVELFNAAAQPHAKDFPTPDGNERMRKLVTLAQRVLFAERVEVGKHALAPPGRTGDHDGEGRDQHARNQEEHARIDAAQEQDAHGDHRHHHEGAHVRLGQQQHTHNGHGGAHGQHGAKEALFHIHLAHHVVGRIHQHGKLGQLRGLEVHDAQRQPAPRTIDHNAHMRDQHRHQQDDGDHEQPGRHTLPGGHGHLERQQRHYKTDNQRTRVKHEEVGGRDLAKTGVVRHGNRRRIHHDQPPGQQRHHHPQQGLVKTQHGGGRAAGGAVIGAAHAHRQHIGGLARQPSQPSRKALPCTGGGGHCMPSSSCPASCASSRTASQNTCARCA